MRQFGHITQQLIALVQQTGRLGVGGALLGELGIHHGHLLGQRVNLVYLALQRLAGFLLDRIQLR